MDLFEEWLSKKEESAWMERALTDPSYNAYKCRGVSGKDSDLAKKLASEKDNFLLALLGDAVIKLAFSEYFVDKADSDTDLQPTEEKAKFESDQYLVENVASHYSLLDHIKKDKEDPNLPDNYDYNFISSAESQRDPKSRKKKKSNHHKYIATCVEAVIGAIFKETRDLDAIKALVVSWIDFSPNKSPEN